MLSEEILSDIKRMKEKFTPDRIGSGEFVQNLIENNDS